MSRLWNLTKENWYIAVGYIILIWFIATIESDVISATIVEFPMCISVSIVSLVIFIAMALVIYEAAHNRTHEQGSTNLKAVLRFTRYIIAIFAGLIAVILVFKNYYVEEQASWPGLVGLGVGTATFFLLGWLRKVFDGVMEKTRRRT